MAKNAKDNMIGSWAFLIGVLLAIVLGFMGPIDSAFVWILVVIGLIVGFLNVTGDESSSFLTSGAVLIIASALGQNELAAIPAASGILSALMLIFVPATIIVAVKNVFRIAHK